MHNNSHIDIQGYRYDKVDQRCYLVRIAAVVVLMALAVFLWYFAQEGHAWKQASPMGQNNSTQVTTIDTNMTNDR